VRIAARTGVVVTPESEAMDTTRTLRLIDGDFRPSDAARLLLSLVNSKIDFHTLVLMSERERFGRDVRNSERRLVELKQLRDTVQSICQSAAATGQRVQVKGWIEITPRPVTGVPPTDASTS
jgi:hypothetical protein